MSFIWPAMLVLLLAIPLGIAALRRRERGVDDACDGARRAAGGRHASGRYAAAAHPPHASRQPCSLTGMTVLVLALARPAERHRRPTVRGDGHPVVRRVGQHGRHGHPADPHGGGQGGSADVRRRGSRRRSCSASSRSATRASRCSSRPPTRRQVLAAIDRLGPERGTSIARGILSSLTAIAAAERDPEAGYYTNRSPDPDQLPADRAARDACPGGDRPAHRRREQPAARSARSGRGGGRAGRPHLHGRARDRRRAPRSRSRGSASTAELDETIAPPDRGASPTARTTPRPDPAELAAIYDDIETRFVIRPEATEVTSLFAGAGVSVLLGSAGAARSGWGACRDRLPRAGGLPAPGRIVPVLVVAGSGCCAAGSRHSAIPAWRSSGRRSAGSSWIRRHLPFALFTLGLASLVVAMARPVQIVSVPAGRTTVILAMDVSRSMCATDIPPNRLLAAEAAAVIVHRPAGRSTTQIGIVAFAGLRRDRPDADDRPGGAARRHREPDDRPADRDRQRDPRVARRDRRDR